MVSRLENLTTQYIKSRIDSLIFSHISASRDIKNNSMLINKDSINHVLRCT